VDAISVEDGALHVRFGNQAGRRLHGKTLSLLPAVAGGDPPGDAIVWLCAPQASSSLWQISGHDRTDIEKRILPRVCRDE
jgi:type IV pilus assembly protein PilA